MRTKLKINKKSEIQITFQCNFENITYKKVSFILID